MYRRTTRSDIKFIAIDWGNSNFRAYAVDAEGNVRQRTKAHQGVSRIKDGNFAATLKRLLGKWFNKYPQTPLLMVGMIGSDQGWQEIEHAEAPLNVQELSGYVEKVFNHRFDRDIYIVPGVKVIRENHVSFDHVRGEEVQVFGVLKEHSSDEHQYICCPGTHSKWLQAHNKCICDIHTFITGEMFSLISRNSLLAQHIEGTAYTDIDAFDRGLNVSQESDSLLADIYLAHTECVAEQINRISVSSFVSGVLVGNEIKAAKKLFPNMKIVTIIGAPWLIEMYQKACDFYQLKCDFVKSDQATVNGLTEIYQHMQTKPYSARASSM
jgi:2-dehydro-3-deoxygalactonokinase